MANFVIDLQRQLKHEKYVGDQMDFIYIDEVQDLTMSQLALFKHMCNNVDDGFVFSGDTAQTIARGIDFRFQDIWHLFYKKFVLESRTDKYEDRKEKGQISEVYHLTQNFRTHAGILNLSQSIIELIYRFFPFSIDVLKPESSLIYGEAPVVLESGENENAIIKIFGNIVGFGAEQVILVRDDSAQKEISNVVGKHALVLTIVECKGLEFQDVLLYNFFSSSPLRNQWRVIYDYMKEQDLLDSTLPKKFPSFNEAKHNILFSELKQVYVAVTRTRQRLWVCETVHEHSKPMFDYWKKKCLVQVRQLDDSLAQAMQVASSTEEWRSRGIKLYRANNYEMATLCFERAGDTYWEQRSKAAGFKAIADCMRMSNLGDANSILREATEIFDAIGKADSAARCFSDLGEYERAARIYFEKCGDGELERAAECFTLAGCYDDAAEVHAEQNSSLIRGEGIHMMEEEFLESCALHYHRMKDSRSMIKFMKAFQSILLMRNFLKSLGSLDELILLEDHFGNYLEAAEIAQLKGDILLQCDYLGKAGEFKEASMHVLFYVLASSLWSSGSKGWPMKKLAQNEALLTKAKSIAKNETADFYELVCTEGCLETQDVNVNRSYQNFCLNYLGVWRLSNQVNFEYILLLRDAEWVRDVDSSYFRSHGQLVSIDVQQLISAAQKYWGSELLSVGIKVLEKLEALFKFCVKSSDSTFFQSKALTFIFDVGVYLLNSKCLKRRSQDTKTLQKFVTLSTESSKNELSYGQIGRIAMTILGSGKLNFELSKNLVKKLEANPPWKDFMENLCASTEPENTSEKPREVSVMWLLSEALVETYNANWRVVRDYVSPGCFFYLVERLLIWASRCQGYVITTSSCFTEWSHITEQLPWKSYDTLKRWMKNNFVKIINVNVLAIAFKKINNALVIVSFGLDCSRVLCPDTIFVDMKATQCKDDLFRKMFPKAPVIQAAQGQIGSMEAEANTLCGGVLSASDIRAGKTSLNSSLVAETDIATDEQFDTDESTLKSAQPDAVSTSASATQGNKKGTRKNNPKKHKGRKGRK
ncbi:hypothetical protein ACLB2K_006733 [Fragaria x ananassa]